MGGGSALVLRQIEDGVDLELHTRADRIDRDNGGWVVRATARAGRYAPLPRARAAATVDRLTQRGWEEHAQLHALLQALPDDIRRSNGLKNLLAGTVNAVAGVFFVIFAAFVFIRLIYLVLFLFGAAAAVFKDGGLNNQGMGADQPLFAELVEESHRDAEDSTASPDVFAENHDAVVALHLVPQGVVYGLDDVLLGHYDHPPSLVTSMSA